MVYRDIVTLSRAHATIPWGFRLYPTAYGYPEIIKIRCNTIASQYLCEGLLVTKVGEIPLFGRHYEEILDIIQNAGNTLVLAIQSKHQYGQGHQNRPDFEHSELVQLIHEHEMMSQQNKNKIAHSHCGFHTNSRGRSKSINTAHREKFYSGPQSRSEANNDCGVTLKKRQWSADILNRDFEDLNLMNRSWAFENCDDPEREGTYKGDNIPSKAFRILQNMVQYPPSVPKTIYDPTLGYATFGYKQNRAIYKLNAPQYKLPQPFNSRTPTKATPLDYTRGIMNTPAYQAKQRQRNNNVSRFGEVTDNYTDF